MNPFQRQVHTKVFVLVTSLLLLGLAGGAFLLNRSVTSSLYAGYQDNLRGEVVTIEQALEYAFMINDFKSVQKVIANLSYQGPTSVIRVLNGKGTILASSIPDEVGVHLDFQSPQCQNCHSGNTAPPASILQTPIQGARRQTNITANPLDNQIACQTCHPSAGPTLGVILAEHDMGPMQAQAAGITARIYLGAGALFLLVASAFGLSYHRLVSRPLHSLAQGDSGANLAARPDEIGILARQMQELDGLAKEKGEQLEAQRRSFQALLTLSESIDVTLTAEKVLQFAIPRVKEVTGIESVAMRLFDHEQQCFRLVAQNAMSPRMVKDLACIPAEIGFTGDVYRTHRAAFTSDLQSDPRLESPAPVEAGYRSVISVPFLSGERLMGSMELATKEHHRWNEDEVRWLELVGRSIGNVLHHIETSSQLQGLAVMQERSRIAQEIHDGLAQLVGTLRLWAEQAQLALQEQDLREVKDDLQKIELTARDAYAGLREEILGLRDTLMPGQGLVPVLREFLSRYQRQWGIETKLLIQDNRADGATPTPVSPAAEIQLLRIIQEGLTNVRRHANAARIVVSVEDSEERLKVEICDDGQGFDPHHVSEDKLGLRIMRERAASVGGRVAVVSGPARDKSAGAGGTRLVVELPKHRPPGQTA